MAIDATPKRKGGDNVKIIATFAFRVICGGVNTLLFSTLSYPDLLI
jgi:hypothetical protein